MSRLLTDEEYAQLCMHYDEERRLSNKTFFAAFLQGKYFKALKENWSVQGKKENWGEILGKLAFWSTETHTQSRVRYANIRSKLYEVFQR